MPPQGHTLPPYAHYQGQQPLRGQHPQAQHPMGGGRLPPDHLQGHSNAYAPAYMHAQQPHPQDHPQQDVHRPSDSQEAPDSPSLPTNAQGYPPHAGQHTAQGRQQPGNITPQPPHGIPSHNGSYYSEQELPPHNGQQPHPGHYGSRDHLPPFTHLAITSAPRSTTPSTTHASSAISRWAATPAATFATAALATGVASPRELGLGPGSL
ncbi:hypothetical protein MRX96_023083 [Rhipicephalus microplus]